MSLLTPEVSSEGYGCVPLIGHLSGHVGAG